MGKFTTPKITSELSAPSMAARLIVSLVAMGLLAGSILLAGCENVILDAKNETVDAVKNLQTEAINVKEGFETKIEQIEKAKDSVGNAVKSVDQAMTDVRTVVGGGEKAPDEESTISDITSTEGVK